MQLVAPMLGYITLSSFFFFFFLAKDFYLTYWHDYSKIVYFKKRNQAQHERKLIFSLLLSLVTRQW